MRMVDWSSDVCSSDLAWGREHPNFRYVPGLSEPTDDCQWSGRTGFVHRAVMEDFPYMSAVQVYACGAPVMVDAARQDFSEKCNLPSADFFADSFVTSADVADRKSTRLNSSH